MHRSGTSALAGMLGMLGAKIGSTLLPAHPEDNPKGYWENTDIVSIHDEILATLGSSWDDECSLPPQWWQFPELKLLREELMRIVQRDYTNASLWVVKDPRLCRLMPLWSSILNDSVDEAKVIFIIRHPYEVAESLKRRGDISNERSYLLWIRYMLDAEKWSHRFPSALVSYEQLLSDWRGVSDHIVQMLNVPIYYNDLAIQRNIDLFLEPKLRHHMFEGNLGHCRLLNIAQSIYHSCLEMGDPSQLGAILRPFEDEVSAITEQIMPWSKEVSSLRSSQADLVTKQAELVGIIAARDNEIDRIKSTVSWQITKPLRFIANRIRR
jgi:hypothetical protein